THLQSACAKSRNNRNHRPPRAIHPLHRQHGRARHSVRAVDYPRNKPSHSIHPPPFFAGGSRVPRQTSPTLKGLHHRRHTLLLVLPLPPIHPLLPICSSQSHFSKNL